MPWKYPSGVVRKWSRSLVDTIRCDGRLLAALRHTQPATTERYSHLDLDPVRAVADRMSRKIAAALRPAGGDVIPLQRKAN